jgi:hypothetical protein
LNRIWNAFRGWFGGGPERLAAQPLIAGYRRTVAPGWTILALAVLSVACFFYGFYFSAMAPARIMPFTVPLAVLAGLVVWTLPSGSYAPTRALEPLYFAFFAALILWPNYLAIALPGLPWVTLLRMIVVPLILVFLICISASPDFRRKLAEVLNTDKWIWRLLVAYVALQTFSLAVSIDPGASINRYLIAQMNWTAIFFVSVVVFMRKGFATHWSRMLIMMLFVLCFLAIWESRVGRLPWAGHIPSIFKIEDESVLRILAGGSRAASGIYRVSGTATTPLGLAEILGLATPFAIHILLERYPIIFRILGGLYIPIAMYAILLTDSRLGMVASLASMMIYLLFWGLIRWRQQRQGMIGPIVVLTYPAMFLAFMAATFAIGRLRARVWGNGTQAASDESRREQWAMAIPKALKRPWGYGYGKGGTALGFTNGAGVLTIDSYYLSVLLELGFAAFVVYYGMMLRAAWTASNTVIGSRQDQEIRLLLPMAVALLNFVLVKSVFSQDANHPLIFMMLGAVVALTYRSRMEALQRNPAA